MNIESVATTIFLILLLVSTVFMPFLIESAAKRNGDDGPTLLTGVSRLVVVILSAELFFAVMLNGIEYGMMLVGSLAMGIVLYVIVTHHDEREAPGVARQDNDTM